MCSSINYFINSNSSKGYVSLMDSNFSHLNKVVHLNGYPSVVMLDIISNICAEAREMDFHTELIHNCLDDSLEGVIIQENNTGVINFPLYSTQEYNIASILNNTELNQTKFCLESAWKNFSSALKIHDKWEKIYISNMDFNAANHLAAETIEKVFKGNTQKKQGIQVHRFFGAATINGPFDYIENLTTNIKKRYFIKGRPGTGKSTFLKKIAEYASASGFNSEVYHCALDPNSIDMVILRELNICLFDSTSPHEYYPSHSNDEIIDIYKAAVKDNTDEKYRSELTDITAEYKSVIAKATKHLVSAKQYYDEVQRIYITKINTAELEIVKEQIKESVLGNS